MHSHTCAYCSTCVVTSAYCNYRKRVFDGGAVTLIAAIKSAGNQTCAKGSDLSPD